MSQITDYFIALPHQSLAENVCYYLDHFGMSKTAAHSLEVAKEAERLAVDFALCPEQAFIAGALHDIGGVVAIDTRVALAESLGMTIFEEDRELPLLLHQNFSRLLAREVFHVTDEAVLSAIACHTTLKEHASQLDKVIFIADKIKWDRKDAAPYLAELQQALKQSLEAGCLCYLEWALAAGMPVIHPHLAAAYEELNRSV